MGVLHYLCCENHKVAVDLEKHYMGNGEEINDRSYSKFAVDWQSMVKRIGPDIFKKVQEFLVEHDPDDRFTGNCTLFISWDDNLPWDFERGWKVHVWHGQDKWSIETDAERDIEWETLGYLWKDEQGYVKVNAS